MATARLVGLAGHVPVHLLIRGDEVFGEVVVPLLPLQQERGCHRVAQTQDGRRRIARRIHGRHPGLYLLGGRVDVLVVEVRVPDLVPTLGQRRRQHLVHGVLVVRIIGADDPQAARLTVEVLSRVVRLGVADLAIGIADAGELLAPPLAEGSLHPRCALTARVEVRRELVGELVTEAVAAEGDDPLASDLGETGGANRREPLEDVRVIRVDDAIDLGDQAGQVGWHAPALALVGDDLHLAAVEHEVLVDEVLHRRVEGPGVVGGDELALGLEDGVDLGAVVGHVVDDSDGIGRHPRRRGPTVVRRRATRGARHARGRPVRDVRIELAPRDAVRRVS